MIIVHEAQGGTSGWRGREDVRAMARLRAEATANPACRSTKHAPDIARRSVLQLCLAKHLNLLRLTILLHIITVLIYEIYQCYPKT
jgi:hypothetical protein